RRAHGATPHPGKRAGGEGGTPGTGTDPDPSPRPPAPARAAGQGLRRLRGTHIEGTGGDGSPALQLPRHAACGTPAGGSAETLPRGSARPSEIPGPGPRLRPHAGAHGTPGRPLPVPAPAPGGQPRRPRGGTPALGPAPRGIAVRAPRPLVAGR